MLIAIITDTHAGKRSDNINLLDHQKAFYDDVFFPYLREHDITTCIHLGDIVDRQKFVNWNTFHRLRVDFLDPLLEQCNDVHVLAGNHDTYFKDRNDLNALDEIFSNHVARQDGRLSYYTEPEEISFGDLNILMLPWICRDNHERSLKAINDSASPVCLGHLAIDGFEMHKGSFCTDGLSQSIFRKFQLVCSGHFHHKSRYQHINYLGCPFQMDWGDYGDEKGFHILDTESNDLRFVRNPYSLFHKVPYDDREWTLENVLQTKVDHLKKSFVRVSVNYKTNQFWFEQFIDRIEAVEPCNVQIMEDTGQFLYEGDVNELMHVEDTITMLTSYTDDLGLTPEIKTDVNVLFQELYNEANNMRMG